MATIAPIICVVGSANVDLTFRTPRLPRSGETVAGTELHRGFGGKGANQAVAVARLGARVSFVARVGDDPFGDNYLRHLAAEGLDTTHVRRAAGAPTGTAAILVDNAAQNCIVVVPGANATLTPQDVRDAAKSIRSARVLLAQLETPLETVLEAFRIARAADVRTILTPAPPTALPEELVRLTDLIVLNETELEVIGGPADPAEHPAERLRRLGTPAAVVTLGERGAWLWCNNLATPVNPCRVQAVDPTGAGDAFTAALAVGWAIFGALEGSLGFASAAAALTVTRHGTQSAFPTGAEVQTFLANQPSTSS